jgi:hypothetical protein
VVLPSVSMIHLLILAVYLLATIARLLRAAVLTRCGSRVGQNAEMHNTAFQRCGRV